MTDEEFNTKAAQLEALNASADALLAKCQEIARFATTRPVWCVVCIPLEKLLQPSFVPGAGAPNEGLKFGVIHD